MGHSQVLKKMLFSTIVLLVALGGAGCGSRAVIIEVTATPLPATAPPPPTPTPGPRTVTVCSSGCDYASIKAAMDDASLVAGSTIEVTDAVHTEGDIAVSKDVTIQGQGAEATIVQAHAEAEASTDRVFYVPPGVTASIRQMTIRHGFPDLEPKLLGVRRCGGGVANEGTLTLEAVVITENTAGGGAGIWNKGTVTVVASTISNNTTGSDEEAGFGCAAGGGIKTVDGLVELIDTTISENAALSRAAGIHIGCASTVVLTNTTISGNTVTGWGGGGIHVKGTLVAVHSTIVDNEVIEGCGGILNRGRVDLTNSIVANNRPDDCVIDRHASASTEFGTFGANVDNLIGDGGCEATFSGDPLLGPLADNGGATLTHVPLDESPAIDAGACLLEIDQRGSPRPQGEGCDIGAVEVE